MSSPACAHPRAPNLHSAQPQPRASLTRVLLGALAAAALYTATPLPALACKCAPPPELAVARDDATAVFEGRVLTIDGPGADARDLRVELAVVRTWKGLSNDERVTLITRADSAACGFPFERGESYLVFAGGEPNALDVSHCGRTRNVGEAGDDLAALGAGITPVRVLADAGAAMDAGVASADAGATPHAAPASGGCASGRSGSKGALLWLGIPSLSLVARRRRRR